MKRIYLDYASLTPIDRGVMKEMKKYSRKDYSNPSSLYASGVASKKAIEEARSSIARILHAHPDEIIFTSGGTESNDIVLKSFENKSIVISAIEHSSIIKSKNAVHVGVDKDGIVNLEELKKNITTETDLVSIMMVNNEIGSIQPIQDIAKIVRDAGKRFNKKIFLHTDACQAMYIRIDIEKLGIDFLTLDGNKMYGPRGVGILYVKRGTMKILRAGTENVSGIMGFAYALELADKIRDKEYKRINELKDLFVKELFKQNPEIKVNGDIEKTSPHILNISIPNIDNEFFVLKMDAQGIECSTKSACLKDQDESYVLKQIGANSKTSVRFSFGRDTRKKDIYKVLKVMAHMGIM